MELWADLQLKSVIGFRFLLIGSGIVIYIIALYYYKKAKSLWRDVDNREDNWEKIEQTAEIAQVYVNILNVSQLVLFAASMYMLKKTLDNSFWTYFVALIGYIFFMFAGFAITRGTINLVKEMNPEKRGSAYDMKFKEKWYESCDEAERSQIGIASYKAYNVTMHCCLAMIVILTILCMAFELGLLPVFRVGIIWMVQTVVYQTYARKAGKMLNSDDK